MLGLVFGFFVGLCLGFLAKRSERKRGFKGPSSTMIQNQIFSDQQTGRCYQFTPETHVCPPSVDVSAFEHSSEDEDP
jgi:hypothetical protein